MDKKAIQQLFMQHYAKMQRVARTLLYDEQESEDVVSDIFLSLLRSRIELLSGTEERYLLTSVRNQCLKRMRHQEVRRRMELSTFPNTVQPDEADDERLTDIVEFVVSHLSEQRQRIFRLRFSDGCSYEDIAVQEGISKVAVWKHLSYIINAIKKHLQQ